MARFIPFLYMIRLFFVRNSFKVRAHFPSVSKFFRVSMQVSSSRAVRTKIVNFITSICVVLALTLHALHDHMLYLRAFCSSSNLCPPGYDFGS